MFDTLAETLKNYPTKLSASLLPFLYDLLQDVPIFSDAGRGDIIAAYALRHIRKPNLRDKDLVDAVRLSNEEMQAAIAREESSGNARTVQELEVAYSSFIWSQWTSLLEPHLVSSICNPRQSSWLLATISLFLPSQYVHKIPQTDSYQPWLSCTLHNTLAHFARPNPSITDSRARKITQTSEKVCHRFLERGYLASAITSRGKVAG